jgi:acetyl esterase/lipase
MTILAYILSGLSLLMSFLLIIRLKVTLLGLILWSLKLTAGALSPLWAVTGTAGAVLGWVYGAYWAIPIGLLGAGLMIWYVIGVSRDNKRFEKAFGTAWKSQISPEQTETMLKRRWTPIMMVKASPAIRCERNIPFCTIPGIDRELLCDIWRPSEGNESGLAFIYFHGSGWYIGDKDFGTQPFFSHLAAQGHTVMDVSYRLFPEVDMYGMIGDVKRAIAWMKTNASRYGVDPERVVLGGGSAGAHLAMLAAYAPQNPVFSAEELNGADLSVCGVISYYGPTDLVAFYRHTGQQRVKQQKDKYYPPLPLDPDAPKDVRNAGRLDKIFGGHPEEVPDMYQLFSTNTYIQPSGPPTLLIQGEHDRSVPVNATRTFYTQLVEAGVPAINVVLPWTDHGFDLLFPQLNPAFQSALYEVDRFLALLVNKD